MYSTPTTCFTILRFFVVVVLLLTYRQSTAQNTPVEIYILTDKGEIIPGALFKIIETDYQAVSDINGAILIKGINLQRVTVEVRALGFMLYKQQISLSNSGRKVVIQLTEDVQELGEVIVTSTAEELTGYQTFKPEVVSMEAIRSSSQDVPQIMGQLPGIRIRQEGGMGSQSNIMLNGIDGKGVRVFIDDLPVYLLGDAYNINNISPNMISRIEVYKGLIPVKFGSDALGGVINIVSRYGNSEYIDMSYSYGSWNTHRASFNSRKFLGKNKKFYVGVDGFYNYSDNDYWMDGVEIVTDTINFNTGTGNVRRFNDAYESVLGKFQVGVRDLSWADELQITSSFSNTYKEWQHGLYASQPWGEPYSTQDSWSNSANWVKYAHNQKWDLKITAGYTYDKLHFVDTARKTYYWDQNYQTKVTAGESGLYSNGTTPELITETIFSRESFNYQLNSQHKLNVTMLITHDELKGRNKALSQENQAKFSSAQTLIKTYSGLALESSFLNENIKNVLSAKHYYSYSKGLDYLSTSVEFGDMIKTTSLDFGYGDALQYLWKDFTINIGYEYTIRQPDKDELFGNYITIAPNAELEPESSHNFNLGTSWESSNKKLSAGTSFFYRKTADRIFTYALTYGLSYYVNLLGTKTAGVTTTIAYEIIKGLRAGVNATYQNITLAEVDPDGSLEKSLIGARIPNVPYLFSNAQLSYSTDMLNQKGTFNFVYDYNYVHEFYLTWTENGKASTKDFIPTQSLHNINISWISSNDRWSLGAECKNALNTKVYDNFSVQKPGRSFYLKVRWFIDFD